ncbi:MAG: aldehyde dehydrogenase family protein, partial [Gammaproteobacteria bacterium]|nr:aldehyde dehydrogenase family protein [Gammaproteobacteria bacterium]
MKNTIKSINPANETIIQEFPDWGMDEIKPIIEAADNAFEKWQLLDFPQRAQCFFSMAKLLRERKADYALLMAIEMGKPVIQGEAEIEKCAWVCE